MKGAVHVSRSKSAGEFVMPNLGQSPEQTSKLAGSDEEQDEEEAHTERALSLGTAAHMLHQLVALRHKVRAARRRAEHLAPVLHVSPTSDLLVPLMNRFKKPRGGYNKAASGDEAAEDAAQMSEQAEHQAAVDAHKVGAPGLVLSIWNTLYGTGMLCVPWCFAKGGLVATVVIILVQAAATGWTANILVVASARTHAHSISELTAKRTGRRSLGKLVTVIVACLLVGAVCVFAKFICTTGEELLAPGPGPAHHTVRHKQNASSANPGGSPAAPYILPALCLVMLIVGSLFKDGAVYSKVGAVGPFLGLFVVVYVIIKSVLLATHPDNPGHIAKAHALKAGPFTDDGVHIPFWIGPDVGGVVGVLLFNFLTHPVVIELASMLKTPPAAAKFADDKYNRRDSAAARGSPATGSLVVAFVIHVFVMCGLGIACLEALGPSVPSSALSAFSTQGALAVLVHVALGLQCFVGMMSLMGFLRTIVFDDLLELDGKTSCCAAGTHAAASAHHQASRVEILLLNLVIASVTLVVNLVCSHPADISMLVGIIGAVAGFFLAFAVPACLVIADPSRGCLTRMSACVVLLMGLGIAVLQFSGMV